MHADVDGLNGLSRRVIGCAYTVLNTLGAGYLEKVYDNALAIELGNAGLDVSRRHRLQVFYDGIVVGEYVADMIVERSVLIELKAVRALDEVHKAQCLNYLKAAGLRVGLLLNFGLPRLEIKRLVNGF